MFVSVRARFRMILNASLRLFFEQLPGQSRAPFAARFVLRHIRAHPGTTSAGVQV